MLRSIVVAVAATSVLAAGADTSQARVPTVGTMFWPFGAAQVDPEKPMCIGVQTTVWGDGKGNYTGKCRYGAPLGPMQAATRQMDRRSAVANARENGLPENDGDRLQTELDTIARLPVLQGRARLKRHARNETLAARGESEAPRPSWLRRAAVNCAIWGAIAAESTLLYEVTVNRKLPAKELAKNAAMGCAMAVITPGVGKWIKSKGYDMGPDPVRQDKITAITVACVIGLFLSWRGLESFGEDGLTFSEWAMAIGLAVVFAAAGGRVGYLLIRRYNPEDDDE